MKIFTPVLDSVWRLTADWPLPYEFLRRYDNSELMSNITGEGSPVDVNHWPEYQAAQPVGFGWWDAEPMRRDRFKKWSEEEAKRLNLMLPKGTVIVFDRYHISHSGDHAITIRILASPELRFVNKKNGGKGKGKMRAYLHVEELNTFPEVEQVHDFKT